MLFFDPDDAFFPWLIEYVKGRIVFDIGCGEGHLLKRMWSHNIKAAGIDKYAHAKIEDMEVMMRTLPHDATDCRVLKTTPNYVGLFCRPNHTGWVANAIVNSHDTADFLYISKPENVEVDLPNFTTELLVVPGCTGHVVHKLLRPYPKVAPYYFADADELINEYYAELYRQ